MAQRDDEPGENPVFWELAKARAASVPTEMPTYRPCDLLTFVAEPLAMMLSVTTLGKIGTEAAFRYISGAVAKSKRPARQRSPL